MGPLSLSLATLSYIRCVHYVKVPEYSSKEVMKRQLLIACQSRGFHLN